MMGPVSQPGPGRPVFSRGGISLTGDNDRRVVLLRAVEFVRELVVDPDAIDLRGRLIHLRRPGASAIGGDVGPSVVRLDHYLAVFGVNPDIVIVTVRHAKGDERFAAIDGLEETFGSSVYGVGVGRVSTERHIIEWTLNQRSL